MNIVDPKIDIGLVPDGSVPRVIAEHQQDDYEPLPSVITPNGYAITRWQPTPAERAAIARGEDVYVTLLVNPMKVIINPLMVTIGPMDWRQRAKM